MADRKRANPADQGGAWFVDRTCIDCDVARQVAPGLIEEDDDGRSYFTRPPQGAAEEMAAWRALLACPTGSIGAPPGAKPPEGVFPQEVAPGVFLTGYNARSTFGSNAYYVPREGGGLLIDAPRYVPALADALDRMGGVAHVLLTHRDDVGDYEKYARRWDARIWIHEADADAAPDATDVFSADVSPASGVRALPFPGHTRGSVCYLVDDRFLFTGDSIYWCRETDDLNAFRDATWHSWDVLTESTARLAESDIRFEWVLPGHGGRGRAEPAEMRRRLMGLLARMRAGTTAVAW